LFNKLLKLYKLNTLKTPLEDFTTELFVGILNYDLVLKQKFFEKFLKSKSTNLKISTQKLYRLKEHSDCVVDIVIENRNELYFLENKVNSKEGFKQLERYSLVLDKYNEKGYKTKLMYCSKVSEEKDITSHNFKQFTWHYLSQFIKSNSTEKLSTEFIKYLKQTNMSADMTIKSNDLVALENVNKIFNLMNRNLENVYSDFKKRFPRAKDLRKGSHLRNQMFEQNRFCVMSNQIIEGDGWSEVLYGFDFNGTLITQIYLDAKNENFREFKSKFSEKIDFKYEEFDNYGGRIYLEKNIGDYLNNENSEQEIKKWFLKSFEQMTNIILETKNKIEWKNYVA
jgi:hypothetical protein